MKKLLFIDGCIRGEVSRTKRLAEAFFSALPEHAYEIARVELNTLGLCPLDRERYLLREQLVEEGKYGDPMFTCAKQFAEADLILVAAPFWDMGIPALLKTYFENVSVSGVTFGYDGGGNFGGICRAERMVYLTTRGLEIEDGSFMEQASPYLKALCSFFGIGSFEMVSVWGTDVRSPDEVERRLAAAEQNARELAGCL